MYGDIDPGPRYGDTPADIPPPAFGESEDDFGDIVDTADAAEDEEDMYCLKFLDRAPKTPIPPPPNPPPPPTPPPPPLTAEAMAFLHRTVRLAARRASRAGDDIFRTTSKGSPATPSKRETAAFISMPSILDTNLVRTAGCRRTGRHAINCTRAVNDFSLSEPPTLPRLDFLVCLADPPTRMLSVMPPRTSEADVDDVEDQFDTRMEINALTYEISLIVADVTVPDCPTPFMAVFIVEEIAAVFAPCDGDNEEDDARILNDAAVSEYTTDADSTKD
jgi:hypothetical protein